MDHETGHTLSLAALGSVPPIVGFIDDMAGGDSACAEPRTGGHDPSGQGTKLPRWS